MSNEITKQVDASIQMVVSAQSLQGFERANLVAQAFADLKEKLDHKYMAPIMALQNNRLGFKVDKPYDEETVKNCLIEAVLSGVQPTGNQFNIISGNTYITKEGFKYLLDNYAGLTWEITPGLPRISADKTSAAVVMKATWSIGDGAQQTREWDIAVKFGSYGTADAAIGKAERKARKRLYELITGIEMADGEVGDLQGVEPSEITMWRELLADKKTVEELDAMEEANKEQIAANPKIKLVFDARRNELKKPTAADKAKQATDAAAAAIRK